MVEKRYGRIVLVLLLMVLVLGLAGCAPGSSMTVGWSGLAVGEGVIYWSTPAGKLYALDADSGAVKWEFPFVPADQPKPGFFDQLLGRFSGGGSEAVRERIGATFSAPVLAGDLVVISSFDRNVYAVDASSGDERWVFDEAGGPLIAAPALADDRIYIGSMDSYVYVVELDTGRQVQAERMSTDNWVWASSVVDEESLYVVSMDKKLYCFDRLSGTPCWHQPFQAEGAIPGAPLLADGVLYFGALDSRLYAVEAATGGELWRFEGAGNWIWSRPVAAQGTIYVGSLDHKLYALDSRTGGKQWEYQADSPIRSGPAYADNSIYFGTENGLVYALDSQGREGWSAPFSAGGGVLLSPVVEEGKVYFCTITGGLYVLKAGTGVQEWTVTAEQLANRGNR